MCGVVTPKDMAGDAQTPLHNFDLVPYSWERKKIIYGLKSFMEIVDLLSFCIE